MSACLLCANGAYNSATGQSDCVACSTGTYAAATGQSVCDDCPAGTFNPNPGQAACQRCGQGAYSRAAHQVSCLLCAAGTYNPNTGQSVCLACSLPSACPEGSASQSFTCEHACSIDTCFALGWTDGVARVRRSGGLIRGWARLLCALSSWLVLQLDRRHGMCCRSLLSCIEYAARCLPRRLSQR